MLTPSMSYASPAPIAERSSNVQQMRRNPTKPSRDLPKLSTQIARSPVKHWAFAQFSAPENFLARNCPLITPTGVRSAPPPPNKIEQIRTPKRPPTQPGQPRTNPDTPRKTPPEPGQIETAPNKSEHLKPTKTPTKLCFSAPLGTHDPPQNTGDQPKMGPQKKFRRKPGRSAPTRPWAGSARAHAPGTPPTSPRRISPRTPGRPRPDAR